MPICMTMYMPIYMPMYMPMYMPICRQERRALSSAHAYAWAPSAGMAPRAPFVI